MAIESDGGGDFRVSQSQAQDATMIDVGEKGRPLGDPPDAGGVWVRKVVGTGVGGRPRPESLVDVEFVRNRMQLEFPDGEDGEPVITIGEEVLIAMNGLWKQCIIVKVLGRNIAITSLNRKLRELWKPKGGMSVMDLPKQFFMIRFELEEEYFTALTGGPWRVFGSYLMVKGWSPEFDPLRDEIVTTPVWVRISNLPVNFYHPEILMGIAKGLGNPVRVDTTTLHFERARFARVYVEVNLSKPLKGTVKINGERYYVAYEGMSNICSGCGVYGHLVHNCPRRVTERAAEKANGTNHESSTATESVDDGYTTVVRRQGRKQQPSASTVVFSAGKTGGNPDRNLRDISNSNVETIITPNRFCNLEEDTISLALREVGATNPTNKENEIPLNLSGKERSATHVSEKNLIGGFEIGSKGRRDGPKDRRTGSNKVVEVNVSRPKQQKSHGPTRGLVFGPIRSEEKLSVSGKRMRVEGETVGRSGGVFVTNRNGELESDSQNPSVEEENTGQMEPSSQNRSMERQCEPPVSTGGSMES
ncbi:uncharacterized protein LOC112087724 [Eutrema salsugineum]|uniref:uncharacterized protein LOC112087724 n=1 Tax=Eutrema salsugineum TaxID=72664 RepID=UPI000CED76FF|nr:uncharacterized protein LOC112087724 [Eutrema salsugineum]